MDFKPAQARHLRKVKSLYQSAFPRSERQPWRFLLRQQKRDLSQIYAATDAADAVLGLAVLVAHGDIVMINYLAVSESARGGGLGTQMLAAIARLHLGKRLVLEIETPDKTAKNNAQRQRREVFYERSGFTRCGVRLRIGGNDMTLLTLRGYVSFEEYCQIQRNALGAHVWKWLKVRRLPE